MTPGSKLVSDLTHLTVIDCKVLIALVALVAR